VAADPELADAHVALAWALVGDGRADEAVEAARAAVALEPHQWVTHHALGWALHRSTPPRNEEAVEAATRALELEPGATPAHSVLGLALAATGRRRAGRRVLREGLRIAPDDPYLHNNLAKIDLDSGLRVGRTARHLRAAAGSIPQEPVVHRNLDTLLLRFGVRLVWPTLAALAVLRAELTLGAPWWVRAVTGIVHLGLVALLVGWFARQVPRGLVHWGRGALGRLDAPLRVVATGMLVFGAAVVVTAFAPRPVAEAAQRAAGVLVWVVLALAVGTFAVSRRRTTRR
jgi:tetratricopeptide (TPR) repeat protein